MDYDFSNDWVYLKAKKQIPSEIVCFLEKVFLIIEVRERIHQIKGIKFEVRTREANHTIPHIHAEYSGYNISIDICTGNILAGNLPKKQEKLAKDWVIKNHEMLLEKWHAVAISATTLTTISGLNSFNLSEGN